MSPTRTALLLLLAASAASNAAAPARAPDLPPPGLYRVDMVGGGDAGGTGYVQRTDGDTGDVTARSYNNEGHTSERNFAGHAPVTHCIRPSVAPPAAEICRALGNGAAQCSHGITLAWRRVDATTWEVDVDQTPTAPTGDLSGIDALAAQMARNAPPAERAKILEQMRQTRALQQRAAQSRAEIDAKMAEALRTATPQQAAEIRAMQQAMQSGGGGMHFHATQRLTRIGDTCR